jgi:long-chain acyl-CoA synthetase
MGSSPSVEAYDYDAQLLADTAQYSVEIKNDEKLENVTAPRRHPESAEQLLNEPLGVDNIYAQFQIGVKKFGDEPCFGTRVFVYDDEKSDTTKKVVKERGDFKWLTFKQVDERVQNIGKGLQSLGIPEKSNIGIFSINRAEWCMASLGNYSCAYRTVALYDTLGDNAVEYIINHAELPVIFVAKDNIAKVIKSLEKFEHLKYIIQFDASEDFGNVHEVVEATDVAVCKERGVELIGLSELLKKGADATLQLTPPSGDDLALIMYTSGTTGMPKGVMLAHRCIVAQSGGVPGVTAEPGDAYLSFLPLAHILESCVQAYLWSSGVKIAFYQGNPKKLVQDFCDVQPSLICGVPRVFQRMYQQVFEKLNDKSCLVRFVFHQAYAAQTKAVREGRRDEGWDNRVFNSIKNTIGMGKTKVIMTGGAPCPPYLIEFLRVVVGGKVLQAYGLTETSAGGTAVSANDLTVGHVGAPAKWAEVRLKTVDEMNYRVTDVPPKGEIQIRGAAVFKGYYKNDEATRESFDGDWFCTGDIGRFNPNGTLSIIDRKKNIFKLAHGEYIAVEKVEAVYSQCTIVSQLWVYGNSYKPQLVGIAVPAPDVIYRLANEKGFWDTDSKPGGNPKFIADYQRVFAEHQKYFQDIIQEEFKKLEGELKGFEKVAKWHFETNVDHNLLAFTVDNDCLTPTFKMRRNNLLQKYIEQIKQMYTDLGEPPKADERWLGK